MGCGASNASETVPQNRSANSQALRLPQPYRHGSPITAGQLNNQRSEFWATRVDGNALMWQAIRCAAEAMLNNDLTLANAILEASNISSPAGTLEVCYDERGHQYKTPIYCMANPVELIDNENPSSNGAPNNGTQAAASSLSAFKNLAGMNRQNKTADVDNSPITLKIRINPGDVNLIVNAAKSDTIFDLKRHIVHKAEEMTENKLPTFDESRQRIIFMGKELHNIQVLSEIGVDESRVLQVFLRAQSTQPSA